MKAIIQFTNQKGEVLLTEDFSTEEMAHEHFESLELIRHPITYKGYDLNLSEFDSENTIGSVKLVVGYKGKELIRRELYRNAG